MPCILLSTETALPATLTADDIQADAESLLIAARLPESELSLVICDDDAIRSLNRQWRQKDEPTDVLSFPQEDDVILGDLVISLDTAARQAAERDHDLRTELRILLLHGLLHLIGYDHETGPEDLAEMMHAEQRMMARLQWTGSALIERAGV